MNYPEYLDENGNYKKVTLEKSIETRTICESRYPKCPRCGKPVLLPSAIFCCMKCVAEDLEECEAEFKKLKEKEVGK